MEKDFRHMLNALQILRRANCSNSTIEHAIKNSHAPEPEKRIMSILNNSYIPQIDKIGDKIVTLRDADPYFLIPYEFKESNIIYN